MRLWPSTLPECILQQGFGLQSAEATAATAMDYGPEFRRRRTTSTPQPMKGQIVCSRDQFRELELFVRDDLYSNTLKFVHINPITGMWHACRFASGNAYSIGSVRGEWLFVTINLEMLESLPGVTKHHVEDKKFGTGDGSKTEFTLP